MQKTDRKLKSFTSTIISDAEAERRRVMSELSAEKEKALRQAEADIQNETEKRVKAEESAVRKEAGRVKSRRTREKIMELNARRETVKRSVLDETAELVAAYARSDKYIVDIREKLVSETGRYTLNGIPETVSVYLRADDLERLQKTDFTFPDNICFIPAGDGVEIEIGGFVIVSGNRRRADFTLDSALNEAGENFLVNND